MPYNSHMPIQQSKNLYGVKGWLMFFVICLYLGGAFYLYQVITSIFLLLEPGEQIPKFGYFIIRLIMSSGFSGLSFYLVYIIYQRRDYAPQYIRAYLIGIPALNLSFLILSLLPVLPQLFSRKSYIFFTIFFIAFALVIAFTIPWIKYFNNSVRVRNTFEFYGTPLPLSIQCPACSAFLALDEDERRNKPIICASCGKAVSKESVLSSAVENEQTQGV
ncbi:MAG TPA: hypothetical protein VHO28_12010 [Ignavibacteriales bacterium]|nr:hypothetical protein [Ignavibacteriales bacterium]